jgi:hypothetical protein
VGLPNPLQSRSENPQDEATRHPTFYHTGPGGKRSRPWHDTAILKPTDTVRLTPTIKHLKRRRLERVEVRATIGEAAELPYAVHLERLNRVLRDRLDCLTRKTPAFGKAIATWDALFGVALFARNGIRPHVARRPLA